jgi:GT2 family glycosyltransferase
VVLTRDRRDSLARTLEAIRDQSRQPDAIFVIDNDSHDGTPEMVASEHPEVTVIETGMNLGAAGGRSRGLDEAFTRGHDLVWLVDDDTVPAPETLATTLALAAEIPLLGMLGQKGGLIRRGLIRHGQHGPPVAGAPRAHHVDFVLTDGAVVTREAYKRAGVLDRRYFIMMEDVEYPLRVKRAGLVVACADLGLEFHHLGALGGASEGPSAPWRLYYQTRNHLRMALDHRSPALLFGWLYRQIGGLLLLVRQPDHRSERLRFRLRGALDGMRGRMGLVVPPQ